MKKIFSLLVLLFATSVANAQELNRTNFNVVGSGSLQDISNKLDSIQSNINKLLKSPPNVVETRSGSDPFDKSNAKVQTEPAPEPPQLLTKAQQAVKDGLMFQDSEGVWKHKSKDGGPDWTWTGEGWARQRITRIAAPEPVSIRQAQQQQCATVQVQPQQQYVMQAQPQMVIRSMPQQQQPMYMMPQMQRSFSSPMMMRSSGSRMMSAGSCGPGGCTP